MDDAILLIECLQGKPEGSNVLAYAVPLQKNSGNHSRATIWAKICDYIKKVTSDHERERKKS